MTYNQHRQGIALRSREYPERPASVLIPVNERVKRLLFLHTMEGLPPYGTEVFRYIIHFSDGTRKEIPVRSGIESDDWREVRYPWPHTSTSPFYRPKRRVCFPAWANSDGRGFYSFVWNNRKKPDVPITSVEFCAVNPDVVPMLAAVTGERYPHEFQTNLLPGVPLPAELHPDPAGVKLEFPAPVQVPDNFKNVFLSFSAVLSNGKVPPADFEFQVGNSPWLKSGTFFLNSRHSTANYVVQRPFFDPSGKSIRLDSIRFRRSQGVPSEPLKISRALLRGSRNEQPLSLFQAKISIAGGVLTESRPHMVSWRMSPDRDVCELALEYPARPDIRTCFLRGTFAFQASVSGAPCRGDLVCICEDGSGRPGRSPWMKFHFTSGENDFESFPGFLLFDRNSVRLRKIIFRFRRTGSGGASAVPPEGILMNLQLL